MAAIKSADTISKKFVANAAQGAQAYSDGVKSPRTAWAAAAVAAEGNFKTGVAAAAAAGRFGKGVSKAGDAKHLKGCIDKGTVRFGPGVAAAQGAYQTGFDPYRQAISALTLPPRYGRRDPRNITRVSSIATALGNLKVQSST